jgi:DNA invertase Pin-like site-specific DNA recombinase
MDVGYVRVSRNEQNPEMQRNELEASGCERIFEERMSSQQE